MTRHNTLEELVMTLDGACVIVSSVRWLVHVLDITDAAAHWLVHLVVSGPAMVEMTVRVIPRRRGGPVAPRVLRCVRRWLLEAETARDGIVDDVPKPPWPTAGTSPSGYRTAT